jgi:hypothetical protein
MEEGEQSGQVEDDPHRDADPRHEDGGRQQKAAPQKRIEKNLSDHIWTKLSQTSMRKKPPEFMKLAR